MLRVVGFCTIFQLISRSHLGWFFVFIKCFLLILNSNPRTKVDKVLCSHQLFCWNLMAEKLHIWKTVCSGPISWAWPVSWHDKGHWHTPLSFQVVLFVPPFPHAQESQILTCHQVTAEDPYHRIKGKSSLSFCAIPRAKSLKPHKRATPLSVQNASHLSSSVPCRSQTFPLPSIRAEIL